MVHNLTYTNVPNYFFNLTKLINEFTVTELSIIIFINKFSNTKYKTNNQLIIEELGLSKSTVQRSLKILSDLNIISRTKLHRSNSNLLEVNPFNQWNIENKILLLENEMRIHKNSFQTIKNIFATELNYNLSTEEETMIRSFISDLLEPIEDIVVPSIEDTTTNTKQVVSEVISEVNEPIVEETIIEEILIETPNDSSDETIEEIMDSIDFNNVVDEIVDNTTDIEIPAQTQENGIDEEFIDTDYLVERVIKMVEDNTTDKIYSELTSKEEKILNVYIQNFDFNDSELNNKSIYFVNDLLSGELNKIGDQYIRNISQDYKRMFEMLKLVNKSNMKNLNYV